MNKADRRAADSSDDLSATFVRRAHSMTPLAAAVLAALYPVSAVLAQDDGQSAGLEEIIVTATRRESNLQDVPQSITAFTTEDIERQAFQNMEDYMKSLPSMNLVNLMPGRNSVVMRGVSTGSSEYRTDSQVAVYLDEQPMTSISQQVDVRMVDIARIESLPGPQGTLFGSSSQSGTLRIITNKPNYLGVSGKVSSNVATTRGGEGSYDFNGHLNLPLIEDRLAIRAVGFTTRDGGYVDNVLSTDLAGIGDNANVVEDDYNDYTTAGGRLAVLWNISDQWELLGTHILQNSKATGAWESDEALGDYKISRFFDEYRNDDWYQTALTLTGDLGFAELSLTASDFSRDIDYEWDNMAYEQWKDVYYGSYYPLYDSDYTFGTIFNFQVQERSSYEARLTSQGESRFQWMVGAFYEDVYDRWFYGALNPQLTSTTAWAAAQYYAYLANYYGYDVQYPLPETDIAYRNTYQKTIRQTALFSELTYNLTDSWSVTGGARWFEYDRSEIDIYEFPEGLPIFGARAEGGAHSREGKADDVVLKFGSEYHLDDDRMTYFLYSEGFRLGGNNSARAASTGVIPLEYGPDSLRNYEFGFKTQWLNRRLQVNASLFYMKWDDIQINDRAESPSPWWARGTVNAGGATQQGIELSGWYNFTDNFIVEFSAFLANPEFSETFVKQDGDVIEDGMSLPNSPERKYWVALQYTMPDLIGSGDLWFRYDTSYQSETWRNLASVIDNDPDGIYPSWQTGNLQVGLSLESNWDITLMARNVWDERNTNYIWRPEYGDLFANPRHNDFVTYQRPRTVSLTVRKQFGSGRSR